MRLNFPQLNINLDRNPQAQKSFKQKTTTTTFNGAIAKLLAKGKMTLANNDQVEEIISNPNLSLRTRKRLVNQRENLDPKKLKTFLDNPDLPTVTELENAEPGDSTSLDTQASS